MKTKTKIWTSIPEDEEIDHFIATAVGPYGSLQDVKMNVLSDRHGTVFTVIVLYKG